MELVFELVVESIDVWVVAAEAVVEEVGAMFIWEVAVGK